MIVFVMIDGLRPDALSQVDLPNLARLRNNGASTLRASSVMPSITLPCHMSIFHSVPPTRHGITSNDWTPMARPLPGLVELAHAASKRCAFFHNWEPLRNLNKPETLDLSYYNNNATLPDGDQNNAREAVRLLGQQPVEFAFVYIGSVDLAGHVFGWMSKEYLAQAERADDALGILVVGLPGDSSFIVHSDHGGHDRSHGTESSEDMTIPWIASGPTIRRGYEIQAAVSLLDTAPTLARLLGLTPHREWEGHCVDEIFA